MFVHGLLSNENSLLTSLLLKIVWNHRYGVDFNLTGLNFFEHWLQQSYYDLSELNSRCHIEPATVLSRTAKLEASQDKLWKI